MARSSSSSSAKPASDLLTAPAATGPKPVSPALPRNVAKIPPPAKPAAAPRSPQTESKPDVRPAVSATKRQPRHVLMVVSFLLFVLLPSIGAGVYLWTVAVDQYGSKVGFTVRQEDSGSAFDLLGGITNFSGSSSSDTDILFEFIQSQRLVADIDAEVDLHAIWSAPQDDFVFALEKDASIEELVEYWDRMVRVSYGAGSGLIEVEVLAFNAPDATMIARTLFERSSQMINQLSAIARQDAISYAREELEQALGRLKTSRAVVTLFRNKNQLVNPLLDLQNQAGLLASLQSQQADALIVIDLLAETVSASDPRLEQASRRLRVIETRIAAERQKLGFGASNTSSGTAFADLIGEYESLELDWEFAEKTYVTALAAHNSALADARRQTRYLAAYMQPTEAETPEYPKRLTLLLMFSMFVFLVWSIVVLVAYSVKDRR